MAEILDFKCPNCGGAVRFDSSSQRMKCPYCDASFDVDELKSYEEEKQSGGQDRMEWDTSSGPKWEDDETENMAVYSCNSCGGEIIGDKSMGAASCPYCGSPVVIAGQFSGDLRPDYIIPFKLDKDQAVASLKKHLTGKKLLPKIFKSQNHIEEVKGVYVPFWLFQCEADARMTYRATRLRHWSDSKYRYTETSVYRVMREGSINFERVPVNGSSKMPDDLMESVEPFDWKESAEFSPGYLAGYLADRYDVTAEKSRERANARVKTSTSDAFRETVSGYSSVTPEGGSVRLSEGKVRYALYPVWVLNTTWKGQKYLFAMNGQTGKFVGNLPVDRGAYWRWFTGLTAVIGAAAYGLVWLLH